MELASSHWSEAKQPKKSSTSQISSHYPFHMGRSKFIGSFIHEYNVDSREKHRPSKRARQRIKKRLAKLEIEGPKAMASNESGYDTTSGDCQTPGLSSPEKNSFKLTENGVKTHSSNNDKKEKKQLSKERNSQQSADHDNSNSEKKNDAGNSRTRTTSVSSVTSHVTSHVTDKSLRRLLKDLCRCEVSIAKYQTMLKEKCTNGQEELKQVFTELRHHIDARESYLSQELTAVGDNAATILERRKNTARYLKQAVEQVTCLEELQVDELKQQIKQFVTDRRVDEEIGTITRFQADIDDILRHILSFGKVHNVRHLYTEWEENPGEAIEMSKHRLSFPISGGTTPTFGSSESDSSPTHSVSVTTDSRTNSSTSLESEKEPTFQKTSSAMQHTDDFPAEISPATSSQSKEVELQDSHCHDDEKPTRDVTQEGSVGSKSSEVEMAAALQENTESTGSDHGNSADKRLTATELLQKQARVRESLKMQGVFLYHPITGEGPPPSPLPQVTPTELKPKIEHNSRPLSPVNRKKKTPTQLRRERKKRQKERERRQNELEQKAREDTLKNHISPKSCDSKSPDIPSTTDKSSNGSEIDEDGKIWSHTHLKDEFKSQNITENEANPTEEIKEMPTDQNELNEQVVEKLSENKASDVIDTPLTESDTSTTLSNQASQNEVTEHVTTTSDAPTDESMSPITSSPVRSLKQLAEAVTSGEPVTTADLETNEELVIHSSTEESQCKENYELDFEKTEQSTAVALAPESDQSACATSESTAEQNEQSTTQNVSLTNSENEQSNTSSEIEQSNASSEIEHANASSEIEQSNASSEIEQSNASSEIEQKALNSEIEQSLSIVESTAVNGASSNNDDTEKPSPFIKEQTPECELATIEDTPVQPACTLVKSHDIEATPPNSEHLDPEISKHEIVEDTSRILTNQREE